MCLYVYVYVCMYICICMCVYVYMYYFINSPLTIHSLLTTSPYYTHTQSTLIWQTLANAHTTRTHTFTNTNHVSVT